MISSPWFCEGATQRPRHTQRNLLHIQHCYRNRRCQAQDKGLSHSLLSSALPTLGVHLCKLYTLPTDKFQGRGNHMDEVQFDISDQNISRIKTIKPQCLHQNACSNHSCLESRMHHERHCQTAFSHFCETTRDEVRKTCMFVASTKSDNLLGSTVCSLRLQCLHIYRVVLLSISKLFRFFT